MSPAKHRISMVVFISHLALLALTTRNDQFPVAQLLTYDYTKTRSVQHTSDRGCQLSLPSIDVSTLWT